jgi:hypothetical protein
VEFVQVQVVRGAGDDGDDDDDDVAVAKNLDPR